MKRSRRNRKRRVHKWIVKRGGKVHIPTMTEIMIRYAGGRSVGIRNRWFAKMLHDAAEKAMMVAAKEFVLSSGITVTEAAMADPNRFRSDDYDMCLYFHEA